MQATFGGLVEGFTTLTQSPMLLLAVASGLLVGLLVGILPGLGVTAGVAIILPFTYAMDPSFALIFAATIYVGGVFGGSAPSVLFNIPGEASSAATAIDGYPMKQNGQAAKALGTVITSSATGGMIGAMALLLLSPLLADLALSFGPVQYFAVILLAMTVVGSLGKGPSLKGYTAGSLGLLLASIGPAPLTGTPRFAFGIPDLVAGIDFVPAMIGAFALAEVFVVYRSKALARGQEVTLTGQVLTLKNYLSVKWVNARSSAVGTLIGIVPGAGATPASFIAYSLQKKLSKRPELYGSGEVRGVAAPEAANNSAAMGSMIPLLTLGIPGGAVTAVMFGIFQVHGLQPGPLLFQNNSEIVYGIMASLLVANGLQLAIGGPQARLVSKLIKIPRPMLYSVITLLCVVGAYTVNNRLLDVWIMVAFGGIGYFMRKYGYPIPALVLGLILGRELEDSFVQGMILTGHSVVGLFTDPIAGPILTITLTILAFQIRGSLLPGRRGLQGSTNDKNEVVTRV